MKKLKVFDGRNFPISAQMYTRTYDPASDQKYSDLHEQQSTVDVEEYYDLCQDEHYVEFNDLERSVGVNYSKSEEKNTERNQNKQPTLDIKKGQEKQKGENFVKTRRHLKNGRNVDQSHNHDSGKWKKALIFVTVISVIVIASAVISTLVFETKSQTQSTAENVCESTPCLNNGTCQNNETFIKCSCPDGYYGDLCEGTPCTNEPCLNDGQCSILNHTYDCQCPEGYGGDKCQETPCSESPCLHDGTCVIQNSTYTCQCPTGYEGNRCEVTPCSSNPCFNNGACSVSGSSYKCSCRSGYYGTRCERTPCSSNPCLNGYCYTSGSSYRCSCYSGYYGNRCERDQCSSNPCYNGGTCSVVGSSYRCSCVSRTSGTRCENKLCESGWRQLDDECYYFSTVTRSWDSAKFYCATYKGILAEPNTRKKINFLKTGSGSSTYWLGGSDRRIESVWEWDSSNSRIYYTDWHTRTIVEPNNQDGNEDCLSISENLDQEWNDDKCWNNYRFICQKRLE